MRSRPGLSGDPVDATSSGLVQDEQEGTEAGTIGGGSDGATNSRSLGQLPKAARGGDGILPSSLQKPHVLARSGAHDYETTDFGCLKSLGLW